MGPLPAKAIIAKSLRGRKKRDAGARHGFPAIDMEFQTKGRERGRGGGGEEGDRLLISISCISCGICCSRCSVLSFSQSVCIFLDRRNIQSSGRARRLSLASVGTELGECVDVHGLAAAAAVSA